MGIISLSFDSAGETHCGFISSGCYIILPPMLNVFAVAKPRETHHIKKQPFGQ